MAARKCKTATLVIGASLMMAAPARADTTTINVHYAHPNLWSEVQKTIRDEFEKRHPEINVTFDAPAQTYAKGVQRLVRESVANKLPDVAFVGLNRWRILQERDLAVPLGQFIESEKAFREKGYTGALRSLGQYQGKQYALAASASTLVIYANPKLVERAGGSMDDFPRTFDGLIKLAGKINDLGQNVDGVWVAPHDWRFQSMLGSYGGRPMNAEETDITFDSEAGIKAARLYQRFADEGGMDLYNDTAARQAFASGNLGIYIDSSSYLTRVQEAVGDRFDVQLRRFIVAAEDESEVYFPTGGSAAVMLTEDPAKQKAAWEYMTFATGPIGAKVVVQNTGYAPTNATVLQDDKYLGDFYETHPNARRAHAQVAEFSGPWYAYPGPEGVAVTDQIAAALVDVVEGADPEKRIKQLADNVRGKLNMN